jgi:class 3 adenylate cyclase
MCRRLVNVDAVVDEVQEFVTGVRDAPETDRVLATVLMTDIVGSTERATALGDRRWRDVLDAHDRIIDHELERLRGRKVNPTGNGMLAAG